MLTVLVACRDAQKKERLRAPWFCVFIAGLPAVRSRSYPSQPCAPGLLAARGADGCCCYQRLSLTALAITPRGRLHGNVAFADRVAASLTPRGCLRMVTLPH
jgi:hypothetical protein